MLQIMVYAIAVAVLLGAAGLCLERLAVLRGWPRRSAWIAAMLLSVLLPLVMIPRAAPSAVPMAAAPLVLRESPPITAPPRSVATEGGAPAAAPEAAAPQPPARQWRWRLPWPADRFLLLSWAVASLLLAGHLIVSQLQLARRKAGWQRADLLGQSVLVSERIGPALVGSLRPRIVVPRWLLQEPLATQSLILQHEREHIAARDPLLIRAGMLVLVALPWNLPLWWQWRRLRQAIELDCDARVLRTGVAAQAYGETLLAVVGRAAPMPAGTVAMSEPVSALERRIRSLLPDPVRLAALQTLAAGTLAALGAGMAIAMDAPALRGQEARAMPPVMRMERTFPPVFAPPVMPAPAPVRVAAAANAAAPPTAPREPVQADRAAPVTATPDAGISPRDRALQAAVQRYPQLINGPAQPRLQTVTMVLRADGTVYRSSLTAATDLSADPDLARRMDVVTGGAASTYGSGAMAGVVNLVLNLRAGRVWASETVETIGQVAIPQGQQIADLGKASSNFVLQWRVLPADDESRDPAATPPLDRTAQLNMVMRAAVQKYPQLIRGEERGTPYLLYMVVRADGTTYDSELRFTQPPPAGISLPAVGTTREMFNSYPNDRQAVFDKGQPVADLGKAVDDIVASWVVLPADYDESRAAGRVTDAVRAKHSNLMLPTVDPLNQSRVFTDMNLLTVFMSEDGQIARQAVEATSIKAWQAMDPPPTNPGSTISRVYTPPAVPVEAFKVLGLDPEQVGRTGIIAVQPALTLPGDEPTTPEAIQQRRVGMAELLKMPTVIVRYAWPRRPGEPIGGRLATPIGPPAPL